MTLAKALDLAIRVLRNEYLSCSEPTYDAIEKREAADLLEGLKRMLYGGLYYGK